MGEDLPVGFALLGQTLAAILTHADSMAIANYCEFDSGALILNLEVCRAEAQHFSKISAKQLSLSHPHSLYSASFTFFDNCQGTGACAYNLSREIYACGHREVMGREVKFLSVARGLPAVFAADAL